MHYVLGLDVARPAPYPRTTICDAILNGASPVQGPQGAHGRWMHRVGRRLAGL